MRYYISDCHFFHRRLNDMMDTRGFQDEETMNEYMIQQWNEKVRRNDEVVILGDFSWGRSQQTAQVLERLNGRKFLITGNHDHFLKEKDFDSTLYFEWVEPYKEINDNRRRIILSHYPIVCYNHQFKRNEKNEPTTYMLHGHIHKTQDQVYLDTYIDMVSKQEHIKVDGSVESTPVQIINCFCMYSNYVPMTLDEWIEIDRKREKRLLKML